jgi:hypothetical protein
MFNYEDREQAIKTGDKGTVKGRWDNDGYLVLLDKDLPHEKRTSFEAKELRKIQEDNKMSENKAEQLDNVEKALNIKKGEKFKVKDDDDINWKYNGNVIINDYGDDMNAGWVIKLINHPEIIEKLLQKIAVPAKVWQLLKVMQELQYKRVQFYIVVIEFWQCNDGCSTANVTMKDEIPEQLRGKPYDISDILNSGRYVEGE